MKDGKKIVVKINLSEKYLVLHDYIKALTCVKKFKLMNNFPKKKFSKKEFDKTIDELDLKNSNLIQHEKNKN
jgi:hypothetical protein